MQTFELNCPNCGPSYFDELHPNNFLVKCHLCRWEEPNPTYKSIIDDMEILEICHGRHGGNLRTPDVELRHKYSQADIYAKMEELDHRELIEWGVSLRTAWTSELGRKLFE